MFRYFKSTRFKVRMANIIFKILRLLRFKNKSVICRKGVNYEINLSEAIDISLFLFGRFQKHVIGHKFFQLPDDAVIFDIGANFGSICLPLALEHPYATVYAFEPTDYAFAKLQHNIKLNESLQERIIPIQVFVSSSNVTSTKLKAYSSWRIDNLNGTRHPVHMGISKKAPQRQTTLDDFVNEHKIDRLDFIKIDTDGYELDVLKGAINSLYRFKPLIVFELATYILEERGLRFSDYENLLLPVGYRLIDSKTGAGVDKHNIDKMVPKKGSIDIAALPNHLKD